MRHKFILFFTFIVFLVLFHQAKSQKNSNVISNLEVLKKYNNKYPHEVKLLENQNLVRRLKNILGNRFMFLKSTWGPESPIEVNGSIFKSEACERHNCGNTNFIILIDFVSDNLCVGIKEEGKIKTYSEKGNCPNEIQMWQNK